ncbi:hypothetical protein [Actibacterium lipolyticum]|uniref:hypothetical protein n=1 Tax=Actibacterium lipolyticum TaxID=1524263 RepID=UPI000BB45655|nr:hypothetical protein [Actibacterium lipolyticum]
MTTLSASADSVHLAGSTYQGRVVSISDGVITFDPACKGDHVTVEIEVGFKLVIDGTCGQVAPPALGGSRDCAENVKYPGNFAFHLTYSGTDGVSDGITVVENLSYDGIKMQVGSSETVTNLPFSTISVVIVLPDYCFKNDWNQTW